MNRSIMRSRRGSRVEQRRLRSVHAFIKTDCTELKMMHQNLILKVRGMLQMSDLRLTNSREMYTLLINGTILFRFGMLIKRPLIVDDSMVLTGFKEAEWNEKLLS